MAQQFTRIKPITHYNFRYIHDNQPVYYITRTRKHRPRHFAHDEYYSVPFFSRERRETVNVIVAYIDGIACHAKKCDIVSLGLDEAYLSVNELQLRSFKSLVEYFNMPGLVIVNSYCNLGDDSEHVEAYYCRAQKNKPSI